MKISALLVAIGILITAKSAVADNPMFPTADLMRIGVY